MVVGTLGVSCARSSNDDDIDIVELSWESPLSRDGYISVFFVNYRNITVIRSFSKLPKEIKNP